MFLEIAPNLSLVRLNSPRDLRFEPVEIAQLGCDLASERALRQPGARERFLPRFLVWKLRPKQFHFLPH